MDGSDIYGETLPWEPEICGLEMFRDCVCFGGLMYRDISIVNVIIGYPIIPLYSASIAGLCSFFDSCMLYMFTIVGYCWLHLC